MAEKARHPHREVKIKTRAFCRILHPSVQFNDTKAAVIKKTSYLCMLNEYKNKHNIMNETKELVKRIVEGIQEKKGKDIVVADLTATDNTVCKYFVICEGNTPTQVAAIADAVSDYVRIHASEKPIHVEGMRVARWVAMDYSDVMVHVFVPEERDFYNLENLWADAELTEIPNLD